MPPEIFEPLKAFAGLLLVAANVIFGLAVVGDAVRRHDSRRHLAFVGPMSWGVAVLVWGPFGVGLYWVMHYSSLTQGSEPAKGGKVEPE